MVTVRHAIQAVLQYAAAVAQATDGRQIRRQHLFAFHWRKRPKLRGLFPGRMVQLHHHPFGNARPDHRPPARIGPASQDFTKRWMVEQARSEEHTSELQSLMRNSY